MQDSHSGEVVQVSGPLVKAKGMSAAKVYEIVKVSDFNLMGEIIELNGDVASIQVYEETAGVGPGDKVTRTGRTMSVELGPGLLYSLYDGIQRPLKSIEDKAGSPFITRGIEAPALSREKKWSFTPTVSEGDEVSQGDIIGTVPETSTITHKVMVPPGISGKIKKIAGEDEYLITDDIAVIETENGEETLQMLQHWPIRSPRPKKEKIFPEKPLITGIRIIDTLFPITMGGAGCIPGPFGAGKSVTQQWFAKYSDAEVIVYIGCGERGNEMTEAVTEFPELKDPNTGEPLMNRTVLIANTSNMPVAAREASVYSGITIAEYYRDMGYSVALMADSTSRWAEAMREISGRLEEMPGEEGYPAYLASRTAEFYERAGIVNCLGTKEDRTGALTVIGAVSPPGGDLSEPVSQATLRVTKCFWSLDAVLQYKKHFPAINWLQSYSLYIDNIDPWWKENVAPDFADIRRKAMDILQRESELQEIVKLVGMDALSNDERLTLEIAKSIREDFLYQNAFDADDVYTPLKKQYEIMKSIISIYETARPVIDAEDFDFNRLKETESFKGLAVLKTLDKDDLGQYETLRRKMKEELGGLASKS